MTEIGEGERDKGGQQESSQPTFTPTFKDRAIDALEGDTPQGKRDRRTFLTTLAVGALGLTGLATVAQGSPRLTRTETPLPTSEPSPETEQEKVHPELILAARDENGRLGYGRPNVAQYIHHPEYVGIDYKPEITIRREIDISDDTNKVGGVTVGELNKRALGAIRVCGIGYQANNESHDDPQYCFKVKGYDGEETFAYEWLAFAEKVDENPENDELYIDDADRTRSIQLVDHEGNPVDRHHYEVFIPKYVNTTGN